MDIISFFFFSLRMELYYTINIYRRDGFIKSPKGRVSSQKDSDSHM